MRIGIVGASSLLGRELADALGESALAAAEVVLLDEEQADGQMTAVGDEVALIRRIERRSFDGMDLCFFAGLPEGTTKNWEMARDAGAGLIDLTGALRDVEGVAIAMPWVNAGTEAEWPDLSTVAVIPGHGVAVMLGLIATRCGRLDLKSVAAAVMLPASERAQAGLDEMHRQAVSLLSFQSVPREEFDVQVAFNLVPALGENARIPLETTAEQIMGDYAAARKGGLPELTLQMVHAPVFHGYAVSMLLDFKTDVPREQIEAAITGDHVTVVHQPAEEPSTVSVAGLDSLSVRVRAGSGGRAWLWMTADNLRLTASHATACAVAMQRLAPRGKVQ